MEIFLKAQWQQIIMANYEVPESSLIPYLPKGVELDTYNNKHYVSLVGFLFENTRLFNFPIPFLGTFEEINLRFYVVRKEDNKVKRGVVFINETVPYKTVAWLANKLYHEKYTCVPTKHLWKINATEKQIDYMFKSNDCWQNISVHAETNEHLMKKNSLEEFIFEHYYGYTKVSEHQTEEYRVNHPRWKINNVIHHEINCDFNKMYGKDFAYLNNQSPQSVYITNGSAVSINWKRIPLFK